MHLLIVEHCKNNGITVTDLFRAAYMAKYKKDPPLNAVTDDIRRSETLWITPPYVREYMTSLYALT